VNILVGESIFLYVWCGNGVPTPVFLAIHPCLPATIFGQTFSSAQNQMLHTDQYSAVSNILFLTCCMAFLKLRYRDVVTFCTKNWMDEFGH